MAIPLHPDRMNINDWTFLPGIGAALAERIENDRQENGDFGSLDALIRVKGIGKKRISNWIEFFGDA
jgi:competence protein ComEA